MLLAKWLKQTHDQLSVPSENLIFLLGADMALAFLDHLVGSHIATWIRGIVEVPEREGPDDDVFAVVHGLV